MEKHVQERFEKWLYAENLTEDIRVELQEMSTDRERIAESFSSSLTFGTAGLRGIIGAGTNRLNIYTIRKATVGLAKWLKASRCDQNESIQVAIAYDCRHYSQAFAEQAALTLASEGITANVYPSLRSTPQLSYTIRQLNADAGIMITASHNPPEYNGYKVYGSDGAQLLPDAARRIMEYMEEVEDELSVPIMDKDEALRCGRLKLLDETLDERYVEYVSSLVCNQQVLSRASELRILFTPLHGTAGDPFRKIMERIGFTDVHYVEEQWMPDPNFSNVRSPNPEEHVAFERAIEQANAIQADLIMGTDPDADRMGMVIRNANGAYQVLTGNQIGVLLLNYLLSQKQAQGNLFSGDRICKSIVTSDMGKEVAAAYGVKTEETLTGFKYIAEQMRRSEAEGRQNVVFGYEESHGYLFGDQVRDKDALQACLLAAEMTLAYKLQKKTLDTVLERLYHEHGYYREELLSYTFKGQFGIKKMEQVMQKFRNDPPRTIGALTVQYIEDYQTKKRMAVAEGTEKPIALPSSNVLKFMMEDGSWCCVRPSGTEPKLKVYLSAKAASQPEAERKLSEMEAFMQRAVERA